MGGLLSAHLSFLLPSLDVLGLACRRSAAVSFHSEPRSLSP